MNEIIRAVSKLSENPDDSEAENIIALCVRLGAVIKKSRAYIDQKLESGEVLPEDSILYEEMGGVWKLSQLKELGLFRENARILQLSFTRTADDSRREYTDEGYWIDLDAGDILRTENIRPYKAVKYIKTDDAKFRLYTVRELCLYPGAMNRRIRWEEEETSPAGTEEYAQVLSKAESISSAVKAAKNELKNTLSRPYAAVLVNFDSIEYAADGHGVLKCGGETIALCGYRHYPGALDSLRLIAGELSGGAVFGGLFYDTKQHSFSFSPFSVVTENDIIRL